MGLTLMIVGLLACGAFGLLRLRTPSWPSRPDGEPPASYDDEVLQLQLMAAGKSQRTCDEDPPRCDEEPLIDDDD